MKYGIVKVECRHGEYEFTVTSLMQREDDVDIEAAAEDWAATFYGNSRTDEETGEEVDCPGDKYDWDDSGYYFNGGEVRTELESFQQITKEEYDIMNKYI